MKVPMSPNRRRHKEEHTMTTTQQPTIEEAIEKVTCGCPGCLSVPLSVLALELDEPLGGFEAWLESLDIRITVDHVGRRSIAAVSARRLMLIIRPSGNSPSMSELPPR